MSCRKSTDQIYNNIKCKNARNQEIDNYEMYQTYGFEPKHNLRIVTKHKNKKQKLKRFIFILSCFIQQYYL